MGMNWIGIAAGVRDNMEGKSERGFNISGHFVCADDLDAANTRWADMPFAEVRKDVASEFRRAVPAKPNAQLQIGIMKRGPKYEGIVEDDSRYYAFTLSGEGFYVFLVSAETGLSRLHRLLDLEARSTERQS